jgi:hypothetical protein
MFEAGVWRELGVVHNVGVPLRQRKRRRARAGAEAEAGRDDVRHVPLTVLTYQYAFVFAPVAGGCRWLRP